MKIDFAALPTYCIVDRKLIPPERAAKRSVTCGGECAGTLRKIRRGLTDKRRCRICAKPSTPDERRAFKRWRKADPEFTNSTGKRGRPSTKTAKA